MIFSDSIVVVAAVVVETLTVCAVGHRKLYERL